MRNVTLLSLIVAAAALTLAACEKKTNGTAGPRDADKPTPSGQPTDAAPATPVNTEEPAVDDQPQVTLTGLLRGGMMGIGGEHTGWQLEREGEPNLEVDTKLITDEAKALDGKQVTITGKYYDKKYVERGTVRILIAASIKAAE